MSQRWENTEVSGKGTKFCLVIDPEDGTHPIRTYGWTKDEVLEKVARTAEAGQQLINRQRAETHRTLSNGTARPAPPAAPPSPPVRPLTADEQLQATTDLQNPAKAPGAVKTLLRGAGVDLDQMAHQEDIRRVGKIAQEWERTHGDALWSDERNQRLLLDKAALMVGFKNITAATLDAASAELLARNMVWPVDDTPPNSADAPDGSLEHRERTRTATSYRSNSLRAPVAPATTDKPRYTRAQIDAMTSAQLRDKIEHEPGFREWYDKAFSSVA